MRATERGGNWGELFASALLAVDHPIHPDMEVGRFLADGAAAIMTTARLSAPRSNSDPHAGTKCLGPAPTLDWRAGGPPSRKSRRLFITHSLIPGQDGRLGQPEGTTVACRNLELHAAPSMARGCC